MIFELQLFVIKRIRLAHSFVSEFDLTNFIELLSATATCKCMRERILTNGSFRDGQCGSLQLCLFSIKICFIDLHQLQSDLSLSHNW
jgi:hypothetical protein